jgi:hypothetical protein
MAWRQKASGFMTREWKAFTTKGTKALAAKRASIVDLAALVVARLTSFLSSESS